MVQSGQGVWLPQPRRGGRGRRGYLCSYGNGPAVADRRSPARPGAGSADRGRAEGAHRGRTARTLIFRALAIAMVAGLAACQPSASNAVELGKSAAGLEQVPLTIISNGRTHRFTVEVAGTREEQATGLMNRQQLAPGR